MHKLLKIKRSLVSTKGISLDDILFFQIIKDYLITQCILLINIFYCLVSSYPMEILINGFLLVHFDFLSKHPICHDKILLAMLELILRKDGPIIQFLIDAPSFIITLYCRLCFGKFRECGDFSRI